MSRTFQRLMLVIAALFIAGCDGGTARTAPQEHEASTVEHYHNPQVTLENYEVIHESDLFDDLKAKLGEPVETLYTNPGLNLELDGKSVDSICRWKDGGGESAREIVVWIKDGRVLDKGQSGLKTEDSQ